MVATKSELLGAIAPIWVGCRRNDRRKVSFSPKRFTQVLVAIDRDTLNTCYESLSTI